MSKRNYILMLLGGIVLILLMLWLVGCSSTQRANRITVVDGCYVEIDGAELTSDVIRSMEINRDCQMRRENEKRK